MFEFRVFQSRYMAPPDPAGLVEQGWDQQSVHAEVEVEEEQVEDPSLDSLDDVEQQEAPKEAWGKEGGLDVEAEQAQQDWK